MQQPALTCRRSAVLERLGSLRATPWLLALVAAAPFAGPLAGGAGNAVAVPLALLGVNLAASLATHPAFRVRTALLAFHLALLAIAVLAAAGRATSLAGRFELLEGAAFDGVLLDGERGPLHRDRLAAASFVNGGFTIDYAPGMKRGRTRNAVAWRDDGGAPRSATIGDQRPLVLHGYRFYTTPNKGFAPLLRWRAPGAAEVVGAVHLPSWPAHEHAQAAQWQLPGGETVWVMLKIDEALLDERAAGAFRTPQAHRLVVRVGERRAELRPGERLALPGGELGYDGLRTWMGYRVAYDPTLPWLLASGVVAVLALGGHVAGRLRERRAA